MVENPIVGHKFTPLSTHNFTLQLQYVYIISLNDSLALCNKFKVYSALDNKESDEHCLNVTFRQGTF
jgi:hypothetical protein